MIFNEIITEEASNGASSANITVDVPKTRDRASYEYIDFEIKKEVSGISLTWDSTNFSNSLSETQRVRDFRIVVDTDKRTIINDNKKSSTILLPADAINPQVEIRMKIESTNGESLYRYDTVQVLDTVTDGSKTLTVTPTIPTIQKVDLDLQGVYDELITEINILKNIVNNLVK